MRAHPPPPLSDRRPPRSKREYPEEGPPSGKADLAPLIVNPPEFAASAEVVDLLLSLPKIGQVKAHQILSHARIAPTKTLGGITDRQRGELLTLIQH
jgi:hypothetical protein